MDRKAIKGKEEDIKRKADLLKLKVFDGILALEGRPAGLCIML